MEIAKAEFENDYGMTLKWLIDYRDGLLSNPNEELSLKIEILSEEFDKIKNEIRELKSLKKREEEDKNKIIMADGTIKKLR